MKRLTDAGVAEQQTIGREASRREDLSVFHAVGERLQEDYFLAREDRRRLADKMREIIACHQNGHTLCDPKACVFASGLALLAELEQ